jgi:hypothetical protein
MTAILIFPSVKIVGALHLIEQANPEVLSSNLDRDTSYLIEALRVS